MNLNKSLLIAAIFFAAGLKADNFEPFFEGTYIKVASAGTRCGAFTITPKSGVGSIGLESYVFYSDVAGGSTFSTDKQIGYLTTLDAAGRKFRYDSAGAGRQTHYRIYCNQKKTTLDKYNPVSCSEVVDIKSTSHNDACLADNITGVGISAEKGYQDLNLNQSNY